MNDSLMETGLRFFGAVTASVSHEIKNRMAVINEQAGLLEDLVGMARKGRELDLDRLTRLADSVKTQIALADGIIKNMNRFAHSVDIFRQASDLNELLSLAGNLSNRMAERGAVRLEILPADSPVRVVTSPFLVLDLIWLCLQLGIGGSVKGRAVYLGCNNAPKGPSLYVQVEALAEDPGRLIASEDIRKLSAELNAEVVLNPEGNTLAFRFQ